MDQPTLQRVLRQHLRTDQLLGVDSVPVRHALTEEVASVNVPASESVAPTVARTTPPVAPPTRLFTPPPRVPVAPPLPALRSAAPARPPAASGDALFTPPTVTLADYGKYESMDRDTRLKLLTELDEKEVRVCTKCELCHGRTKTVFGEGDIEAKLMFVGEGPGQNEDETGRPFVGRAGELLEKMIVAMGLSRQQVYIANTVKCRPPENRTPTPMEVDACSTYLLRQIRIIQPRVLVALGGPATKFLLQTQTGITALRGTWHEFKMLQPSGPIIPVMPTFHPAYLLRAYTEDNRRKVWSDLQKVMALLKGQ